LRQTRCRSSSAAAAFASFFTRTKAAPREPAHIHVGQGGREAKFWLRPEPSVAYNDGFNARTLRVLLGLADVNREQIEKAWNDFFG
jgi:hypothetical protein